MSKQVRFQLQVPVLGYVLLGMQKNCLSAFSSAFFKKMDSCLVT